MCLHCILLARPFLQRCQRSKLYCVPSTPVSVVCLSKLLFPLFLPPPHFLCRKVLGVQTQLAPRAHRTKQVVENQSQQLTAATPPSRLNQSEAGLTLPMGKRRPTVGQELGRERDQSRVKIWARYCLQGKDSNHFITMCQLMTAAYCVEEHVLDIDMMTQVLLKYHES